MDAPARAGLDRADEAESLAYCERLFADELAGRRLLSNNSRWINFVTLKCARWHHRNIVLLGDAAHTAHFSIGSGTKLAMEDAIVLADAVARHRDIESAFNAFEAPGDHLTRFSMPPEPHRENVKRHCTSNQLVTCQRSGWPQ
jgi:anthraniloyl-CoA monooxygenase